MHRTFRLTAPALIPAIALVVGTGVWSGARADDAAKVTLARKLEKGAAVEFVQTQSQSQNVTTPMGPQQMSNETVRTWTQTVESSGETGATLQVKFGRVKGSATSMMGAFEFDSDVPADPADPMAAMTGPFAKGFTALAGKTATVSVGKDGRIGDVKGIDGVADEAAGGNRMVRGIARGAASPEAVRNWLRLTLPKLPEKAVGVGDTWTDLWLQDATGGSKMKVVLTFKVTSIDDAAVGVAVEGAFTLDAPAAPPAPATPPAGKDGEKGGAPGGGPGGPGGPGGMMRDAKLEKGVMTGTGKVSRADGLVLGFESKSEIVMKAGENSVEQTVTTKLERK